MKRSFFGFGRRFDRITELLASPGAGETVGSAFRLLAKPCSYAERGRAIRDGLVS